MHRPLHTLQPHPSNRPAAGMSVAVSVTVDATVGLELCFRVRGTGGRLRLPAPAVGRQDALWRHTCLETFVGVAGGESYREFNFSPAGTWAAYGFSAYRRRDGFDSAVPCRSTFRPAADGFELQAAVPAAWLPAAASLAVGLSAVLEAEDGHLDYWALSHPPGRPDFHWPGARCLRLPGPIVEERQ